MLNGDGTNDPFLRTWSEKEPWPDEEEPEEEPIAEPRFEPAAAAALAPEPCWRCGKAVSPSVAMCPYCNAAIAGIYTPASLKAVVSQDSDAKSLMWLIGIFIFMLVSTIVGHGILKMMATQPDAQGVSPWTSAIVVLIIEGVDTVAVLAALALIGLRHAEPQRSLLRQFWSWVLTIPGLGAMLLLNVAYHGFLTEKLGLDIERQFVWDNDYYLLATWSLAVCIQPAVIEELFFRYLMFGSLRSVMGGHTVVWITAVMFALAHIGVPLSMPLLFVFGVFLGYARWASGGILLPIVLHFLHNSFVLLFDSGFF